MNKTFPQGFQWGVATSAAQIEGAATVDGRGLSVWDCFAAKPGRIAGDGVPAIACDHYHRMEEDIGLMKDLGLRAYRFSLSWSRIQPDGEGMVNQKGLDFYSRLIDALLEAGIEPWVTLYHWDLPQALQDKYGGWLSRQTAQCFGEYATICARLMKGRVNNVFTINEFYSFIDQGYADPIYAPGLRVTDKERNQARHHALLGHGLALAALREHAPEIHVGIAENPQLCQPAIETPDHIEAARKAFREANGHYLTAVMEGAYPDTYLEDAGADAPLFTEEEMQLIGAPIDVLGMNAYMPVYILADADAPRGWSTVPYPAGYPRMDIGWLYMGPQSTYWPLRYAADLWNPKSMVVSECGACCADVMDKQGRIMDTDRVMFLRNYLHNLHRAVDEGLPVNGFFLWTLMDNFEWATGFTKRFGLYYTQYPSLRRIPKLSAEFYREVIARNTVV